MRVLTKGQKQKRRWAELLCCLLDQSNLNLIRLNLGTNSLHLYRGLLMQLDVLGNRSQLRIMGPPSLVSAVQWRHKEQTTLWYNPVRTELTHTHTFTHFKLRIIMHKYICTYYFRHFCARMHTSSRIWWHASWSHVWKFWVWMQYNAC